MAKEIVLSGVTTSGKMTLGNYIGALTSWKDMVNNYDSYFMVANLHSMTSYQDPKELISRTKIFYAQLLALGLTPDKCTLFVQSQVPEHAELNWILTCVTPLGNLNRMTQFKDKSAKQKSVLSGLLMYPVLMASDILVYQTNLVPVGEDQKQHIELCRDIVQYFEDKYGPGLFTMPKPYIPKQGARVMSLTDPERKMSKSDENENSYIALLDTPDQITKKLKKAVTDSGTVVKYDVANPGVANLLTINSVLSGRSIEQLEKHFEGKMYGHLKLETADVIIETLKPIQQKFEQLITQEDYLESLMKAGAEKAREKASRTVAAVYERIGMIR
jgi:tryptophanyl-tRNA synthetase